MAEPIAPRMTETLTFLKTLCDVMATTAGARWCSCLLTCTHTGPSKAVFEYANATRWALGPGNDQARVGEFRRYLAGDVSR
jgi:hypothetical protein